MVAEFDNKRVQELSPEGVHIRFIGDGVFDSGPCSICTNDVVVITGKAGYRDRSDGRILVFDYDTGSLLRVFGQYGNKPGEVGEAFMLMLKFAVVL